MQIQPQGQRTGWLKNGNPAKNIRDQPHCQAKAKSTGQQCRNIAVKGKSVCQIHGGRSTGVPGNSHNLRHGYYTAAAKLERRELQKSIREANQLLEDIIKIKRD